MNSLEGDWMKLLLVMLLTNKWIWTFVSQYLVNQWLIIYNCCIVDGD